MNLDFLNLAYRQEVALKYIGELFKNFFTDSNTVTFFKRLFSMLLATIECLGCIIFDTPVTPHGQQLDLSDYSIVLDEEFNGDSLNTDIWEYRANGSRRNGFNSPNQVKVEDGNLVITAEYRKDGEYGEGWYAGMINLKQLYCKGYFEIRCKCNKDKGFWSAFWIQGATISPYDHYLSKGGVDSCEIDIFEAMSADKFFKSHRNAVTSTVHCNGVDDDIENIDSRCLGDFKVGRDIYDEYNTYGLEWTDDEYIFYINGVESGRTSFGNGVCQNPEQVIVSLEIPADGLDKFSEDYKSQYIVDYVKIYEKK